MRAGLRDIFGTLGWAAYLACSWTWCIGMFLPVLLVRDYGAWAFFVFAAPNVVGAAAMGWVLASRDSARRIRTQHAVATEVFSGVTILFQLFFLAAVVLPTIGEVGRHWGLITGTVASVLVVALLWGRRVRAPRLLVAAALALTGSAAAGGVFIADFGLHHVGAPVAPERGADLLFLAPVCVFGFLLCPYMDRTFLRARASLERTGARAAFTLGFAGLFLPLILFTLVYAPAFAFVPMPVIAGVSATGAAVLTGHLMLQLIFTIGVHLDESEVSKVDRPAPALAGVALLWLVCVAGAFLLGTGVTARFAGMSLMEVAYRVFMAFYGLLFPAYVWLCMLPTRGPEGDPHAGITGIAGRRKLIVLVAAVTIAAPLYWLGFIERREVWLLPGLGVVLFARILLPGGPAIARTGSAAEQSSASPSAPEPLT